MHCSSQNCLAELVEAINRLCGCQNMYDEPRHWLSKQLQAFNQLRHVEIQQRRFDYRKACRKIVKVWQLHVLPTACIDVTVVLLLFYI